MIFTLTIELGNDAMRTARHVALALTELGTYLRNGRPLPSMMRESESGRIRDDNGNTVGTWEVKP